MHSPFADKLGPASEAGWRARWFHIIFGHDDASGRRFDVLLIIAILGSIAVAVFDTVAQVHVRYGAIFYALEWFFTIAFTLEYAMRIMVVDRPWRYMRSFFGIVDVLAVLPTWISLIAAGSQYLLVVRALRILRIFRILKLTRYVGEADRLRRYHAKNHARKDAHLADHPDRLQHHRRAYRHLHRRTGSRDARKAQARSLHALRPDRSRRRRTALQDLRHLATDGKRLTPQQRKITNFPC